MKLIEMKHVERDYGMRGTMLIIEHPKHGRLLLEDGYGGEHTLHGGAVRWRHGVARRILPSDTIASLLDATLGERGPYLSLEQREVLLWDGAAIEALAAQAMETRHDLEAAADYDAPA